ncbi:MarR family winged helix-turn-helix transcriptional regulator [Stigmatella erecta]|uniref:DNA-binding transcriptional regulator, MarR family n=1 Tax=Stigmatella erecta TaxID=83460 RepID=A0A1I0L9J3_9BACT|nr:MarR family transcriptional regulator [Stigmatella erecta]SEU36032.1 DNA-binding transcriptional regulator, MarR family [Stigmatella erecta]
MSSDPRAIQELFSKYALGPPENAVGFVLWRLVHQYQREADRALAPVDLTHLQFMTLIMAAWLARSGEAVTQAGISRSGDIHPMQVSQVLKTLEAKGMVARRRNPSDIRAKHVEVTAAGLAALRSALPLAIEVQQRLFGEEGRPGGSLLAALLRLDR